MNSDQIILRTEDIHRHFPSGEKRLEVLKGISLEIKQGEVISIVGPSGAGKSTLLHILALLDNPLHPCTELEYKKRLIIKALYMGIACIGVLILRFILPNDKIISYLMISFSDIFFLIGIGAIMKRRGRSAWNTLFFIIPVIGWIILLRLYIYPKPIPIEWRENSGWSGMVHIKNKEVSKLSIKEQAKIRNATFGFIFQSYHLVPELTAIENILLPYMIRYSVFEWLSMEKNLRQRAKELLQRLGLGERMHHKPGQLSGGEHQRVAIARALVSNPEIIFCDEPTGNLDSATSLEVQNLILDLNRKEGKTFIIVTHDETIARKAHRILRMVDGNIIP